MNMFDPECFIFPRPVEGAIPAVRQDNFLPQPVLFTS